MLDGLSDAVEIVGNLLDDGSALNSGNSPAAGPTGSGSAGSAASGSSDSGDPPNLRERWRRSRERARERRRQRRHEPPSNDPVDTVIDMHDPMLQDNVDEAVDYYLDARHGGQRRRKRIRDHLSDLFTKRTRPRFPGNPADQLLSPEGAAAQEGAARYLHEHRNRTENLATSDFDYDAYLEGRQEGPFSRKSESAVDRDGDTAVNRFKDWFWGRSSSEGGGGE